MTLQSCADVASPCAVVAEPFARISYTEAVDTLLAAIADGRKFEFPVSWGEDLKSEHERYLAETVYKKACWVLCCIIAALLACCPAAAMRVDGR